MFQKLDISADCMLGCGLALAVLIAPAGAGAKSKETVLYSFCSKGGCSDGGGPFAGLIADKKGNLYGTTGAGGAHSYGAVFKLSPKGAETVLYSFQGGSDGYYPSTGLVADKQGNLYGTTPYGGTNGFGEVFEIAPNGTKTVLHSFGGGNDGEFPESGLVMDTSGNLYGTTQEGGADVWGAVYEVTPGGTETVLYSFQGGSDGEFPSAGLIIDGSGNLYGTTEDGGSSYDGVVFEVTPNGTETVLHTFQGGNDGAYPIAGLIMDGSGNLYGTTEEGGGSGCLDGYGCGTVFKLAGGSESVLYAFKAGNDGYNPYAGLIIDKKGNLYGTTDSGGGTGCSGYGCGTVFRISPSGTETLLHAFSGDPDGYGPEGGLIAGKKGILYGTTNGGGAHNEGTVFKVSK